MTENAIKMPAYMVLVGNVTYPEAGLQSAKLPYNSEMIHELRREHSKKLTNDLEGLLKSAESSHVEEKKIEYLHEAVFKLSALLPILQDKDIFLSIYAASHSLIRTSLHVVETAFTHAKKATNGLNPLYTPDKLRAISEMLYLVRQLESNIHSAKNTELSGKYDALIKKTPAPEEFMNLISHSKQIGDLMRDSDAAIHT